jgi:hypothetical protein
MARACEAFICGDKIGTFPDFVEASHAVMKAALAWLSPITNPDRQQDQGSDCRQEIASLHTPSLQANLTDDTRTIVSCSCGWSSFGKDEEGAIHKHSQHYAEMRGPKPVVHFPSFTIQAEPSPIVSPHSEGVFPRIERCHADRDGDCNHPNCPQLRDGEPAKTGRHCPIDTWHEVDEE